MKTKEELNALKEEVEALNGKLAELTEDELKQVVGGLAPGRKYWFILNTSEEEGYLFKETKSKPSAKSTESGK